MVELQDRELLVLQIKSSTSEEYEDLKQTLEFDRVNFEPFIE